MLLIASFAVGVLIGLFFRVGALFVVSAAAIIALLGFAIFASQPRFDFLHGLLLIAAMQLGYLLGVSLAVAIRGR